MVTLNSRRGTSVQASTAVSSFVPQKIVPSDFSGGGASAPWPWRLHVARAVDLGVAGHDSLEGGVKGCGGGMQAVGRPRRAAWVDAGAARDAGAPSDGFVGGAGPWGITRWQRTVESLTFGSRHGGGG